MKIIILISVVILLTACGGGSSSNTGGNNQNSELAGTDSNSNGVRDDIDTMIQNYNELNTEQKDTAMEFAKSLQTIVVNDNSNQDNTYDRAVKAQKMQECMALKMPNSGYERYAKEIEAYTLNSESRVNAYIEFEKSISGLVFNDLQDSPCN